MIVRKSGGVAVEEVTAGVGTTRQVLIGPDEGAHFAMRRFRLAPGGSMPLHTNTVEHEQYVLGGRAHIRIGDEEFDVERDDVVYIPAGVPHCYAVQGDEAFEFLCLVPNAPDTIEVLD